MYIYVYMFIPDHPPAVLRLRDLLQARLAGKKFSAVVWRESTWEAPGNFGESFKIRWVFEVTLW